MNFISRIIRRESSSSEDDNERINKESCSSGSPTLPPRPSPKVVEELDLPRSTKRPVSFAERFKKEQVPPTQPRPSPRTVRRITKSTKEKMTKTKEKKPTTMERLLLPIKAITPIQNYTIKFLNRLRRRRSSSEDDSEQDKEIDDESLLRRSLVTLNRSPLVMNISIPQAPSRTQLEKDLTREILNINGSKYEDHVSKGSPEAGFEVLYSHLIILVTRLLDECDDLKVQKVVRRALNSCCRTIHGAESYFAVASVLRTHYPERQKDNEDDDGGGGSGDDNNHSTCSDIDAEEEEEDSKMMAIVSTVAIMPSKMKQPPNISIQISSCDRKQLTVRVTSFNYFDVETENSRLRRVMSSDGSNTTAPSCSDDESVFKTPPNSPTTRSRSGSVDGMWVVDSKIEDLCTYDMMNEEDDLNSLKSSRVLTLCSEFLRSGSR